MQQLFRHTTSEQLFNYKMKKTMGYIRHRILPAATYVTGSLAKFFGILYGVKYIKLEEPELEKNSYLWSSCPSWLSSRI